jgi:hypothetical protein
MAQILILLLLLGGLAGAATMLWLGYKSGKRQ